MKDERINKQIEDFFGHLKALPEYYTIDSIKEIIDQPDVLPNHQVSNYASTFKSYFIMTSISAIIISTVLFFTIQRQEEKSIMPVVEFLETENHQMPSQNEGRAKVLKSEKVQTLNIKKQPNDKSQLETEILAISNLEKDKKELKDENPVNENKIEVAESTNVQSKELSVIPCSWPNDTILDGYQFILKLSKDELENIGFMIDHTGLYYKNDHEEKKVTFHTYMENGIGGMQMLSEQAGERNKKLAYSIFDFYPVYMTDYFFRAIGSNLGTASFEDMKDKLIPVKVSHELLGKFSWGMPHTLWFIGTPKFFKNLPPRYHYMEKIYSCVNDLRNDSGRIDIVNYQYESLVKAANFVLLDQQTLETMGFEFSKNKISFSQTQNACKATLYMKNLEGIGVRVWSDSKESIDSPYNLIFLSDSLGYQNLKWKCGGGKKKFTLEYFKNQNETLIPILLKKSDYPDILIADRIFWFEPTEEMLNVIPGELGDQIRREYKYLVSEDKIGLESSCTFFEVCRSTLHLHDLVLSPNPTSGALNMKFEAGEPMEGTIHLTALNGVIIKKLAHFRDIRTGINSFDFNIGNVPSGIYLFTIQTEKGFQSKRVIVEK